MPTTELELYIEAELVPDSDVTIEVPMIDEDDGELYYVDFYTGEELENEPECRRRPGHYYTSFDAGAYFSEDVFQMYKEMLENLVGRRATYTRKQGGPGSIYVEGYGYI